MKYRLIGWLLLTIMGCKDYTEDFTDVDAVVSTPTFTPAAPQADGESLTQIDVKFKTDVPPEKAAVELKTTAGIFKETGKDAISLTAALEKQKDGTLQRVIHTQLVSPVTATTAILTTRTAGYQRTDTLVFTTALPDKVIVESDKLSLKSGAENIATITVSLLRNPGRGKPASNLLVKLTLQDASGTDHGEVRPTQALSGTDGKCKFLISRGSDTYTGELFVKATVIASGASSDTYKIL